MPREKRILPPREKKKDTSGHVTLTAQESAFYNDQEMKARKIDLMRYNGKLQNKPYRNPILSEKTPRDPLFRDWDYSTIPPRPEFENLNYQMPRWNHPDIDYGLMSKFKTQKGIYEKEKKWEQDCQETIAKHKETMARLQEENERKRNEAMNSEKKVTARDSDGYTIPTARTVSSLNDEHVHEHHLAHSNQPMQSARHSARSDMSDPLETSRSMMSTGRRFYAQPISTMKTLNASHPEILAKWRARRAAEFITTLPNPLEPPSTTRIALKNIGHPRSFVPSSIEPKMKTISPNELTPAASKDRVKKILRKPNLSSISESRDPSLQLLGTSRLREQLMQLNQQLDATKEEISRQELKIALNSKTKSYERPIK